MRRLILLWAILLAALSCKKPLFDLPPRWYSDGPRSHVLEPEPEVDSVALDIPPKRGVYATAIRFPDWAQWREGDFRGAEAVLFRDSVEIRSAPLGNRPDADRIHLWNGHLWTDISDGGVTEIYCDSILKYTFPEEELLRGFLVENGNVHTLGQRPGAKGMSYRINGEEVFSTVTGTALGGPQDHEWEGGALMRDSTGVYYVYGVPIKKGDRVAAEYHVMKGADEIRTIPPSNSGAIYDIRVLDGVVWRSERRNESSQSLSLVMEDMFLALDIGPEEEVNACKLIPLKGEIMMKGSSYVPEGSICWIRSRNGFLYSTGVYGVKDMYVDNGVMAFVTIEQGLVSQILKDYSHFSVPPMKYKFTSPLCAHFRDGFFAVALSDAEGSDHRLILDGKTVHMRFNGYFTSLKIY